MQLQEDQADCKFPHSLHSRETMSLTMSCLPYNCPKYCGCRKCWIEKLGSLRLMLVQKCSPDPM